MGGSKEGVSPKHRPKVDKEAEKKRWTKLPGYLRKAETDDAQRTTETDDAQTTTSSTTSPYGNSEVIAESTLTVVGGTGGDPLFVH